MDVEREAEDGLHAVVVDLVHVVERDVSHGHILQMWNAGPSAGRTPSRASSPYSVSRERKGVVTGSCGGARREHEQLLAARLAQERDRVGRTRARSGCRRGRARSLERRSAVSARTCSRNAVSQLSSASHGIVRRASSPQAPSSPSSSPAKSIGTPGSVICSPRPTRCRSARACDRPEARRVVAVEQVPRVDRPTPTARPARNALQRRHGGLAVEARHADRDAPELLLLLGVGVVAQEPRPERAQEAGVVHDAVPAARAEVGAEVVPVLGDQQAVADLLARPLRDLAVEIEVAVAADHVRDVDAPAVQAELQVAAHHRSAKRSCSSSLRQSSLGSDRMAEPRTRSRAAGSRRSSRSARSGALGLACAARNHSWRWPVWFSVRSPTILIPRACAASASDCSASSPPSSGSTCAKVVAS